VRLVHLVVVDSAVPFPCLGTLPSMNRFFIVKMSLGCVIIIMSQGQFNYHSPLKYYLVTFGKLIVFISPNPSNREMNCFLILTVECPEQPICFRIL